MDGRINDAWDDLYNFEDAISGIIGAFANQSDYEHLVNIEWPDTETIIIKFPREIKVCKECDALYVVKRGCECQN